MVITVMSRTYSETDKAYLAGFLDGEGYIGIYGTNSNTVLILQMAVVNSYLPVLEELQDVWGGCLLSKKRSSIWHKPAWELRWNGRRVAEILIQVLPYLKVKKEQAKLGLKFASTVGFSGRKVPSTVMEIRKQIRVKLQKANKRGL